jgi:hypothetical protein
MSNLSNLLEWQELIDYDDNLYYKAQLNLPLVKVNFLIVAYQKIWYLQISSNDLITIINFKNEVLKNLKIYDKNIEIVKEKAEQYYKNELKQFVNKLEGVL